MPLNDYLAEHPPHPNPYSANDIITLLRENHWLITTPTAELLAWAERAAQLLGHYAEDRAALANLLRPVFHYDAARILQSPDAQAAISRYAARDVTRDGGLGVGGLQDSGGVVVEDGTKEIGEGRAVFGIVAEELGGALGPGKKLGGGSGD